MRDRQHIKFSKDSCMERQEAIFNISETIRGMRKSHEDLERAVECFRRYSSPVLTDLSMVPVVYEWFCEVCEGRGREWTLEDGGGRERTGEDSMGGGWGGSCLDWRWGVVHSVERRRQFLFIILYLYAPVRLFSGKMPKGLRQAVARVLGVQSGTVLSDNANDVLKRYEIYKSWARDVDGILCVILARLQGFCDNGGNVVKQGMEDDKQQGG